MRFPLALLVLSVLPIVASAQWPMHVIDSSSEGADGIRLSDLNGDGRLDVVTGWEEGGQIRYAIQPTPDQVKQPWTSVLVAEFPSPEDAVAVDLDGDGVLELISSHEGNHQTVWIHERRHFGNGDRRTDWSSTPIAETVNLTRWMYALPMANQKAGFSHCILASKGNATGQITLATPVAHSTPIDRWTLEKISSAGWVMSLIAADMNSDGVNDVLVTDRKGPSRGLFWLQQPVSGKMKPWIRHEIGLNEHEVMFMDTLPSPDGPPILWIATRDNRWYIAEQHDHTWSLQGFENPFQCTAGKAVAVTRLPDGQVLIAHTSNTKVSGVQHRQPGVAATKATRLESGDWSIEPWTNVSGVGGSKFDQAEWIDLDQDGDLDILTCEEVDNLGVVWYEQPNGW